jgi:hypothetical protein
VRHHVGATDYVRCRVNLDSRVCQHMNTQLVFLSSVLVGEYVVRSGYQRCMREEGYTEGGSWKGYWGWREE